MEYLSLLNSGFSNSYTLEKIQKCVHQPFIPTIKGSQIPFSELWQKQQQVPRGFSGAYRCWTILGRPQNDRGSLKYNFAVSKNPFGRDLTICESRRKWMKHRDPGADEGDNCQCTCDRTFLWHCFIGEFILAKKWRFFCQPLRNFLVKEMTKCCTCWVCIIIIKTCRECVVIWELF